MPNERGHRSIEKNESNPAVGGRRLKIGVQAKRNRSIRLGQAMPTIEIDSRRCHSTAKLSCDLKSRVLDSKRFRFKSLPFIRFSILGPDFTRCITTERKQMNTPFQFIKGDEVIYGLIGKCTIAEIESKKVGNEEHLFYRLERVKPAHLKAKRPEPQILLPLTKAEKTGLRKEISALELEKLYEIFSSRELFLPLNQTWAITLVALEQMIRAEGAFGLARAYSFLFVLQNRQHLLNAEQNRFFETVRHALFKELSDVTQRTFREIETEIHQLLKTKLKYDH